MQLMFESDVFKRLFPNIFAPTFLIHKHLCSNLDASKIRANNLTSNPIILLYNSIKNESPHKILVYVFWNVLHGTNSYIRF